ncbi:uncharacterized protein HMPREF1541_00593 [Cyphellophora europaea CBS 101466]|uniref:Zeta toxin domain-containing protein n=1 Tax=Cyphellophora europaea (strain CBS 101466) TaxID=1220924 RepID=W2SEV0_CYPE1|nr:uncharacterized protein HMPREF1541_00593 [Cyphellophora europaea CBS 101466]ETN46409.1 hypothetical protein HMPREF1541_00593 [Cyphellophora europaea CBS 101466]
MPSTSATLDALTPLLQRTTNDPRPVAVMMCGLCGTGKSSLAHAIVAAHHDSPRIFTRLSLDGIVHERHGLYGVDYEPALREAYEDEAEEIFGQRLREVLSRGGDVVLDRAFYAKEDRVAWRGLVEGLGARVVLVFFKVRDREVVWRRVRARWDVRGELKGERKGDVSVEVTREFFDKWVDGFEEPVGEGEWVVEVEVE